MIRRAHPPNKHLDWDAILLDRCDQGRAGASLRFWSSDFPCVVLGFANDPHREVNLKTCAQNGVPIYRRCSGGGAVVIGPGCLNYSLILPIAFHPMLASVQSASEFIMKRNQKTIAQLIGLKVNREETDLVLDNRKFSGNAQRRRRSALLFHGTFLLDFDISCVTRFLKSPSRAPEYRLNRSHREFLCNISVKQKALENALCETWQLH